MLHIHWFRQDLRLTDNPALFKWDSVPICPIYILDDVNSGDFFHGEASRWWLHHSLISLNNSLDDALTVFRGDARQIILDLVKRTNATSVGWSDCYEPWQIERDEKIKTKLKKQGVEVHTDNGSLLFDPSMALKDDGTPYKVFTPFYRRLRLDMPPPRTPLTKPKLEVFKANTGCSVDDLNLLPSNRWYKKLQPYWNVGEAGAAAQLRRFIKDGLNGYKEGRNFPAKSNVSRLSPHLHFGEISPNQVWYAAKGQGASQDVDSFCSELGWREFSHNLLYHFPKLPSENFQTKFDAFAWQNDDQKLEKWQKGLTGYPIVDAGMRELWQTGYMHNRVRMIVGSFLVKNLLLDWRHGERWFWDCLVDADLANNSASWQWVAGCGADAAPYFRIFNPVTQGKKFDPQGEYTRKYVPELAEVPDKYLFCPWEAPDSTLQEANVRLGHTYPKPIVDLQQSRERALAEFKKL